MNLELVITNQEKFDQRPLLPTDIKQQWLEALRSGKYEQGIHRLNKDNKFCCLGVLCEIEGLKKSDSTECISYADGSTAGLPKESIGYEALKDFGEFKGFKINNFTTLAFLNDNGYTFDQIADIIEKYF